MSYAGKQHYLGYFNTKEEAAAAYDTAAREHKGSDVVCNFESAEAAAVAVAAAVAEWEQNPPQPKPRPSSGFYGASAYGSKWKAQINYGGKQHSLGYSNTKEEAAAAYDTAARKRKGSDAVCNFESAEAAAAAVSSAVAEWEQQNPPQPKPRPSSGFYGVYPNGSKWQAEICCGVWRQSAQSWHIQHEGRGSSSIRYSSEKAQK